MRNKTIWMRSIVGLTLVATTLVVLSVAPRKHMAKVYGSDHREAPTVDGLPEGDLTDIYTFTDPNDPTRIVFIMNVNPFSIPAEGGSYSFSPDMLYQFKIDNTGDYREDQVIQIRFDQTGQTQKASVYGPAVPTTTGARNTQLTSAPTATGSFGTTFGSANGVLAFVGLRDDPFVFDIGQFTRIMNGTQDLFRATGSFRGRPLRADGTSGVDAFAGFNVTSVVISVPKSMIRGSGPMINVWATVSNRVPVRSGAPTYQQFEREGQQAFATLFIPGGASRDAENFEIPEHDVANYSSIIPDALTTTDNDGTGNTIAGRAALLSALGLTTLPNGAPLLLPPTFVNTDNESAAGSLASGCVPAESGPTLSDQQCDPGDRRRRTAERAHPGLRGHQRSASVVEAIGGCRFPDRRYRRRSSGVARGAELSRLPCVQGSPSAGGAAGLAVHQDG